MCMVQARRECQAHATRGVIDCPVHAAAILEHARGYFGDPPIRVLGRVGADTARITRRPEPVDSDVELGTVSDILDAWGDACRGEIGSGTGKCCARIVRSCQLERFCFQAVCRCQAGSTESMCFFSVASAALVSFLLG